MNKMKITVVLSILALMACVLGFQFNTSQSPQKNVISVPIKQVVPAKKIVKTDTQSADYRLHQRITQLVFVHQPKKGINYAKRLAHDFMISARNNHLDPLWVATTACIESEFSMRAQPCIGIMQVTREIADNMYPTMDPWNIEQNIEMGANDLSRHYYHIPERIKTRKQLLASRGGYTVAGSRLSRMKVMWGRYNGSGPHGFYVKRAFKVLNRLDNEPAEVWKKRIDNKGALWK